MKNVCIIAEAGVNHNGNIELAKKLIDVAVEAGVDFVKFQTFKTEKNVTKNAKMADYQIDNIGRDGSQFSMIKKLELDYSSHLELVDYSKKKGIGFLSTAFDLDSVDFLYELNIPFWKIPSGEITNLPYLRKIAKLANQIVLSTGMASLSEIEDAINILEKGGLSRDKIIVLHCNTQYPTSFDDVNLLAMQTIKNSFKVDVGYSDHTLGIEVPIAAVAMGAQIIEKHFTLDRNMQGPDHKASLEPQELKEMVRCIRNIEKAMGDGIKRITESEIGNKPIARKSIIANCDIRKGEIFTEKNLTVKRPGNGISPMQWDELIGSVAQRDYKPDDLI